MINRKRIRKCFLLGCLVFAAGFAQAQTIGQHPFPKVRSIQAVTSGPKHHFASAYYSQHAWSASERYIVCLETTLATRKPSKKDKATVGMIDLQTKEFIPLAETSAWNFQQGTFAQWLGSSPDTLIIYNDCRKGRFVSVVLNVHTREERVMDRPVLAVANSGQQAISVNFARLEAAIPGFGYAGGREPGNEDVAYPDNDGLYLLDLETGESSLVVSMADVYAMAPPPAELEGPLMWFHHAHYNPDDSRVFFVSKTRKPGNPMASAAMTMNPDGTDLRMKVPYEWDATHYDWLNPQQMVVTTAYKGKLRSHLLFTDGVKEEQRTIAEGLITSTGHPNFSPDGRWLLTDTYPDELRKISMFLVNMETEAVVTLGQFHSPAEYGRAVRCDLHARWNRTGDKIVFDSAENGTRQVYVMELEF